MRDQSLHFLDQQLREKGESLEYYQQQNLVKVGFHRVLSTSIDHLHMHVFVLPFNDWDKQGLKKYNRFYFAEFDEIERKLE
eukprot:CAMPEP_0168609088 /NCGR_PEP_ID=MMETSP0449_2-20121227/1009_1 /TAXON_ID=1082188 /ORGANISM="Strombidium rassoulzadegani, Strain ras09" /LENGTH=80 /DNA_ID=CAMNT_0008649187 /DNA_START=389 /DNA_END=628 /DNA_ORIENTATION=-